MLNTPIKINETRVLLTTGIYDLLKDHIRRRKLSQANESALETQLRNAIQVLRKDLPEDVVTTNTTVIVKDMDTNDQTEYKFVAPGKARRKHGTLSILSPVGVALVGYAEGTIVEWLFEDTLKTKQIIKVSRME